MMKGREISRQPSLLSIQGSAHTKFHQDRTILKQFSSSMAKSSLMMKLPPEIHLAIADNLAFPDIVNLRNTSVYFHSLIKRLTHKELLEAEMSPFANLHHLYTCMDCVRLRPSSKFADNMRKGKKRKEGQEKHARFCVECGIRPKPRTSRYSPGTRIVVNGENKIMCISCHRYKNGVTDSMVKQCEDCWNQSQRQHVQSKITPAEWKRFVAGVRSPWGSDFEESDNEI